MTINALDPSQKHTLKSIVADKGDNNISLVYGPPGTGKSQLLVSLLFELSAANKKVLFVSQNTEALEVIDRKIDDLDKTMSLKEDDLSLKDFCLRLYTREHRYLKYIRAQSTRLNARMIPHVDTYGIDDVPQYSHRLSYTNLDRAQNYTVNETAMGVDELLKYFLQYVEADLVVEVIHNFDKVDLRKALSAIGDYSYANDFGYYNQPQNELRFITTTNHSVNLTDIQAGVQSVDSVLSKITANTPPSTYGTTLDAYVSLVKEYISLQNTLNLYRVQADSLDLDLSTQELKHALKKKTDLLPSGDPINGVETIKTPLFTDETQIKFLDADTIGVYENNLKEILKTTGTFQRIDKDILAFEIRDVLFSLLKKLPPLNLELFKKVPGLLECDFVALGAVITDTVAYSKKGKLERLLKQLPESYKKYIADAKKNDVDTILQHLDSLSSIASLLKDTRIKVKAYSQLVNKSHQHRQAINPFAAVDESKIHSLTNKLLSTIELTRSYELEKTKTLGELEGRINTLVGDVEIYKSVVFANRSKVIRLNSVDLVKTINDTIKHNLAQSALTTTYETYGRYFVNSHSLNDFTNTLESNLECLTKQKVAIAKICEALTLPADFILQDTEKAVQELIDLTLRLKLADLYSNSFFVVESGQHLNKWFDMVKNVKHFHNLEELDNYLAHNKFLSDVKNALAGNDEWLESILHTPGLTFSDFASRLVNSLVRTSFQNLPSSKRKILPSDFFKQYETKLKNDRKIHYIEGLRQLDRRLSPSARFISNPNNWEPGASTMEKIRNNTKILKEAFPIFIATPKEVAKYISPTKEVFDYVVFDEASQLLPGQALPSIYRAKKAVIVGDPHQMPPSLVTAIGGNNSDEEQEDVDVSDSILDMVKNMQPESQYHLKVHYRSESNKLFQPSHEAIYAQDGIQAIYEAQMYNSAPIEIADNLGHGIDQTGQYDKNFRGIVTRISEKLEQDPKATFCVLFLRAEDLHSFKDYLATYEAALGKIYKLYSENKILVSTITNCQGIEGTHSILYFRHYDYPSGMWFFREAAGAYKRLNVAITRQRRSLSLLLADPKEKWLQVCEAKIDNNETPPNTRKSAELLRSLLNSAGEVIDTEYLDRHLGENSLYPESPLVEQVYKMLSHHYKDRINKDLKIYCGVGWHMLVPDEDNELKRNIGFRVDIGIYSMSQKKFVLGIEIDDSAYHIGYDREHSDYERLMTLKIKGWDIYRLWSTNWLNGQTSELASLTKKIDKALVVQPQAEA